MYAEKFAPDVHQDLCMEQFSPRYKN